MLLVDDILEEISDHVGGHGIGDIHCSDAARDKALKTYHEISRLLMNRGDFEGTDREICLTVDQGCITLDRRIETVKQFLLNNKAGRVYNDNFKYLQQGPGSLDSEKWQSGATLEDVGDTFPLINDLEKAMFITAHSDRPEDSGTELTVYGYDEKNKEVSRYWEETGKGYTIELKEKGDGRPDYTGPDSRASGKLSHIEALRKTRTKGYISVYGYLPHYDDDTGELDCYESKWLVTMAPDETNAQHRRYKVPGASEDCDFDMTARVSLRWHKQYLGDVALIQNIDSHILMAKALTARDDNEMGLYSNLRNAAISELKHQRAKKHPAHGNTLNVKVTRKPIRNSSTRYRNGGIY